MVCGFLFRVKHSICFQFTPSHVFPQGMRKVKRDMLLIHRKNRLKSIIALFEKVGDMVFTRRLLLAKLRVVFCKPFVYPLGAAGGKTMQLSCWHGG